MSAGYGPNLEKLQAEMINALDEPALDDVVFRKLGTRLDLLVPSGLTFDVQVQRLLQRIEASEQRRGLVDAVVEHARANQLTALEAAALAVKQHLDQVAAGAWYAAPEAVESCFVRNDWPFVNRRVLRDQLRALVAGPPRTLVVRGQSRYGRTYSKHLIAHVAAETRHSVYPIDLRTLPPGFSPHYLATLIVQRVNPQQVLQAMPAVGETTPASTNLQLAAWVIAQVESTQGTWWLVLDGADKAELREETWQFIEELMSGAEQTTANLRVVVLACVHDLTPELEEMTGCEQIERIDRDQLEDFFRRLAEHLRIDPAEEQIALMATTVLAATPPDEDPDRLRTMKTAISRVARLFADPPDEQAAA